MLLSYAIAMAGAQLLESKTALATPPVATRSSPAAPAGAGAGEAPLKSRADQLPQLINGSLEPSAILFPGWEQRLPPEQWARLRAGIQKRYGNALRVADFAPESATKAKLVVLFENGALPFTLEIDSETPHLVTSFRLDQ